MIDHKRQIPFFLCYAHDDLPDVARFRKTLQPFLKSCREFAFGEWIDCQILPGEPWRAEIKAALGQARFGLLLVSPAFLASGFILQEELPALLAKPMVVPVALQAVPFDGTLDLGGLEDRQVFRDSRRRPFDACRTSKDRRDFALKLFQQTIGLLKKQGAA